MVKFESRSWLLSLSLVAVTVTSIASPPTTPPDEDARIFELGDFRLESGVTLPIARLSYVTHGRLDESGTNAILMPSFFTGNHHGHDFLIGPDKALDPADYFIVATNMFTNGLSSSPSNAPPPFSGPDFPEIARFLAAH
jgi:homoserine O-acetyltransferase